MLNKDLEYILKFDENKLFNTALDDECTNKVKARKYIQKAKQRYYEHLEKVTRGCDVSRAFNFCKIHCTNTPHQGLMYCIENVLKYSEYLWLLEFTANKLREVEQTESEVSIES